MDLLGLLKNQNKLVKPEGVLYAPHVKCHWLNGCKVRYQRGWTQNDLEARMQIAGCDMSREVIANIETGRSAVSDTQVYYFALVFGIDPGELFPRPPKVSSIRLLTADKLAGRHSGAGEKRARMLEVPRYL